DERRAELRQRDGIRGVLVDAEDRAPRRLLLPAAGLHGRQALRGVHAGRRARHGDAAVPRLLPGIRAALGSRDAAPGRRLSVAHLDDLRRGPEALAQRAGARPAPALYRRALGLAHHRGHQAPEPADLVALDSHIAIAGGLDEREAVFPAVG